MLRTTIHAPAGHSNVHYLRGATPRDNSSRTAAARGGQEQHPPVNRRSALLNRAVFRDIYPGARHPRDVPSNDVLMIVAGGHCVKPEIFNRVGPCIQDTNATVVVVPPSYHNAAAADPFDTANSDTMHTRLPHAFAGGLCLVPGTPTAAALDCGAACAACIFQPPTAPTPP